VNFENFSRGMEEMGGIVEERIEGHDFQSPSVQMRVSPLGEVEILSTHDQLLGGPSGGSFLGSTFPADPGYGPLIASEAEKIGERLADLGALGRFAVDFVVVRGDDDQWDSYAIEVNLRLGGTTHPFQILQFLTEGSFYSKDGVFRAPSGQEKYYVASDHLESTLYRAFAPNDLFDIVIRYGLHFDQAKQTGVLLHMLPTVGENGRFGVVAVGNSPQGAEELYERVQAVIQEEAERVTLVPPLPKP
jgi:predicted ATP-grasp superfamily ATP-dependent carboligase